MSEEIVSARAYKSTKKKIVTLPSGFKFEIRKVPPSVYGDILAILDVSNVGPNEATTLSQKHLVDILKIIIPRCVVRPKIVVECTDDEDVLCLDDLDYADGFALLDHIYEFSGITAEAAKNREKFREN